MCLLNELITSGYLYVMMTLTDFDSSVIPLRDLSAWGLVILTAVAVFANLIKVLFIWLRKLRLCLQKRQIA
jgi:hypothetical protein